MSEASPITGNLSENDVIIDFGRYVGLSVSAVAESDPDFYRRLIEDKDHFAIRRGRDKTFRLYVNPLAQLDQ
jgi:hypothetical protein